MIRSILSFAIVSAAVALPMVGPARASFTIEGDAKGLTVVVDAVSRRELVTAIVQKFGLEVVGASIEESAISGRFSGTLGHILKSILPRNGYAIAYSDGRPVRVTFTGSGSPGTMAAASDMGSGIAQSIMPGAQTFETPSVPGTLEMRAQQGIATPQGYVDPISQRPPEEPGQGQSEDNMQRDMAEATARAVAQLKNLTADLKKNGL